MRVAINFKSFLLFGALVSGAFGVFLDVKSIILEADNGKYLGIKREGLQIAAVDNNMTKANEFEVLQNDDGTYSFKADNHRYISVIEYAEDLHILQASKEQIDQFCRFTIITDKNGAISLASGGGMFWTRTSNADSVIEAKNYGGDQSKFIITQVKVAGAYFSKSSPLKRN